MFKLTLEDEQRVKTMGQAYKLPSHISHRHSFNPPRQSKPLDAELLLKKEMTMPPEGKNRFSTI
jgi:hypothetical protein